MKPSKVPMSLLDSLFLGSNAGEFSYSDENVTVTIRVAPFVMNRFYSWTRVTCRNKFSCGSNKLPVDAESVQAAIKKEAVTLSNQVLAAGYKQSAKNILRQLV